MSDRSPPSPDNRSVATNDAAAADGDDSIVEQVDRMRQSSLPTVTQLPPMSSKASSFSIDALMTRTQSDSNNRLSDPVFQLQAATAAAAARVAAMTSPAGHCFTSSPINTATCSVDAGAFSDVAIGRTDMTNGRQSRASPTSGCVQESPTASLTTSTFGRRFGEGISRAFIRTHRRASCSV
jgi:hypothetical protein